MSGWPDGILKDPDKRAILSWLGGGAVVVAGGIWPVVTFVVEHKDAQDKKVGTTVTVSGPGQGIASGGDMHINGPVTIGPSKEQIEQIQKPTTGQLSAPRRDAHSLNRFGIRGAAVAKSLVAFAP